MKSTYHPILSLLAVGMILFTLTGCEDPIDIKLDTGPSQLAVDGWLTRQAGPQTIRLTRTTGYFDAALPPAATGATVTVTDDKGKVYSFVDRKNEGNYAWVPAKGDTFGRVGGTYQLTIRYEGEEYRATSEMRRVPAVDSITFSKQKINPLEDKEGYLGEFFATDPSNGTDYYWIRTYTNNKLLDDASDILVSYDGSFNASGNTDGLLFILPVRLSINVDTLFRMNDTVRVDVLSITPDAFYFFQQLSTQINNGGLFATPPANVPTNVLNVNSKGPKAVGYFGVSAVGSRTVTVGRETIRAKKSFQ